MSATAVIDLDRLTPERAAVYFIQAEGADLVKIGRTVALRKRLGELQIGSPLPLRLLGAFGFADPDGAAALERALHRRFRADRARGEWFRPSQDVRRWTQLAAVVGGRTRYELPPEKLVDELRQAHDEGALL